MRISASTQVRGLANAVAVAFASANLTDAERHPQGGIEHTDLPWACPPLITSLILDGALQDHLDAPINVTANALHQFWMQTMHQMWHEPSRVMRNGTFANLGAAMPQVKMGQRALRFSQPIGAPSQIDQSAGIMLSLEVAHCAAISLPVKEVFSDDSNYRVITADGYIFGVGDGRPLTVSPWTYDASGTVTDLLTAPRGEMSYTCHYDQIAAVRSIVHTNAKKFPYNFDAMDQALQTLRYLSLGGYCPELTTALVVKPLEVMAWREKEFAYREALDVLKSSMSDRAKLFTLRDKLVPQVMTVAKFKREVFSSSTFPFSMAPGKTEEIVANLVALYKNEVPQGLQQAV